MARKRMIDPNLWTDEGFLELSMPAKMLFIGMISHADDEGRGPAKPNSLKARIFPADNITGADVLAMLVEIKANTRTMIYKVDGVDYYQLSKWHDYQSIDRPTPSKFPKYNEIEHPRRTFDEDSTNNQRTLDEDSTPKELKERREIKKDSVVASAPTPVDNFVPPDDWGLPSEPTPEEQPKALDPAQAQEHAIGVAIQLHMEATKGKTKPTVDAGVRKNFKRLIEAHSLERVLEHLEDYYLEPHWFTDPERGNAFSLKGFFQHFDELCQSPRTTKKPKPAPAQKCPKCGAEKIPYIDLCICKSWDFSTKTELTDSDWGIVPGFESVKEG